MWNSFVLVLDHCLFCTTSSKLEVDYYFQSTTMDGWMTCDFTSCLTVFQSYQDGVLMIMKGCVQWNSVYG